MTRTERTDLLQICRQRERVAKVEAVAIAARRKSDFATQLATIYDFDNDDIWKAAHKAAKQAARQANEQISAAATNSASRVASRRSYRSRNGGAEEKTPSANATSS